MGRLTEKHVWLLNSGNFATLVTLMPDGGPHATIVWVESDGEYVFCNSAAVGKTRNLNRDSRVALTVLDPADPYANTVAIRGRAELTHEGADEHMNRLSNKYTGHDFDGFRPGETRYTIRITPEWVL
jgi:PPOX class probable F420-dependent enzyme